MSSSFIYHPHVHQSDGTVITPDIAIDRVFTTGAGGLVAAPVSRLTSAAVLQQAADAPVGTPAVVLLAASYGMLVSVGVILDGALALARSAWRYDDIRDGYDETELRSWTVEADRRTPFVSDKLGALMSPADAMAGLGNASGLKPGTVVFIGHPAGLGESLPTDRVEVTLVAANRELRSVFGIEAIA